MILAFNHLNQQALISTQHIISHLNHPTVMLPACLMAVPSPGLGCGLRTVRALCQRCPSCAPSTTAFHLHPPNDDNRVEVWSHLSPCQHHQCHRGCCRLGFLIMALGCVPADPEDMLHIHGHKNDHEVATMVCLIYIFLRNPWDDMLQSSAIQECHARTRHQVVAHVPMRNTCPGCSVPNVISLIVGHVWRF